MDAGLQPGTATVAKMLLIKISSASIRKSLGREYLPPTNITTIITNRATFIITNGKNFA